MGFSSVLEAGARRVFSIAAPNLVHQLSPGPLFPLRASTFCSFHSNGDPQLTDSPNLASCASSFPSGSQDSCVHPTEGRSRSNVGVPASLLDNVNRLKSTYPQMSQTHRVFPGDSILASRVILFLLIFLSIPVSRSHPQPGPRSTQYDALQKRLGTGWNTWDVYSVTSHVLLPSGLAIRVGVESKTTLNSEAFLADSLIGRPGRDGEQVFPGPHAWDGSYTDLRLSWRGTNLRIQSGHAGPDMVILITPLPSALPNAPPGASERHGALPPTAVFSVAYLWNRPGTVARVADRIEARSSAGAVDVYCVGARASFSA